MKEFKALLPFVKPYKWWVLLATFSMILVTGMSIAGPWVIRSLVDTVTNGDGSQADINHIKILTILIVSIYVIRALSRFGTNYISHYAAWKILEDIRTFLYDHMQKLSLRFFKDKQTGDLMSRVIDDTRNFEVLLAHAIPTIIVNFLVFFGVSAILFSMNVTLALYTLIPIPLLVWLVLKFSRISRPIFREAQDRIGVVNSNLQDNFSGIQEIKSFTQENYESNKVSQSISEYTKSILRALKLSNGFHPMIEFVSSLGTVIVIFFGGMLALNNKIPIEDLVAFLLYLNLFYQPITALGQINEGLQQALGSAERVLEVLNEESDVKEIAHATIINQVYGDIEFKNVSFHYANKIPVLKDISFKVNKGETLALVGATGVGKSTIANLVPRFYDPTVGEIWIDHHNINELTLDSLRKQISLVSQDVFLFNGTVRQNILYGLLDATDDDVINAAKAANAHEFILELENGYETKVGERGTKLSGGQKQRISIARAILKNAPILILDEATSAVDTQTEKLIQEAINQLMKNKTSIVIAHRLSTIKEANQIVVLKEGAIIERGTHDELLQIDGLYTQLCNVQHTGGYLNI